MSCSTKAFLLFVSFLATVQWGSTLKVAQTFYGFPDNDPSGPGILLDCGRGHEASGTGTFDDPLTFATAPGSFEDCEVIYDPTLKKYLIHEDYCQSCATEWTSGIWHIDVWVGQKNYNGAGDQINCENKLTSPPQKYVVRNPDPDLPVDTTPLYEPGRFCKADQAGYYLNLYEYNEQDFTKQAFANPGGTRKGIGKQSSSAPNPPANPAPVNPPPPIPAPANPPANVPPIHPPAANPPPANPLPASVPPANPPPVNVPLVNIPPANPPTVHIPPPSPPSPPSGNIPPASIPPSGAPPAAIPASAPPAVPPAVPPVKIPVSVPPPVNTPPPKLPPIIDPPVSALSAKYATATDTAVQTSSTQDCVYQTSTEQVSHKGSDDGQWAKDSAGGDNANRRYHMGKCDADNDE